MAYDTDIADRIRCYLLDIPKLKVEEKTMFGGLAFMVNGKMCVNVNGEKLMCRFDPKLESEVKIRKDFQPMRMKDKVYIGNCYITPEGFKAKKDFEYWLNLCLAFNQQAKSSKKRKPLS